MRLRSRRSLSLLFAVVALTLLAVAPAASTAASNVHARGEKGPHRLGGHVRPAWPAKRAHRPKSAIGRWLARQVGPQKPLACEQRPTRRARVRCRAKGSAAAASAGSVSLRAAAAKRDKKAPPSETVTLVPSSAGSSLQLVRSFDIPADDPLYDRLLNWSWSYDSAITATAFAAVGLKEQSARLLDQLAALQRKDGSIEFAFDVRTGESSASIRSGSVAFAMLAFSDYDLQFGDKRYIDNARLAADYLLSLRNGDGLVRGGPDVDWVSTQHNLIAYIGLQNLAGQLEQAGDDTTAALYREVGESIAKGIDAQLLVPAENDGKNGELPHLRQGVDDDIVPLDTQALGVIYEIFRGNIDLARQVHAYASEQFPLENRTIATSKDANSYNQTYEAKGPFSGYRPYLGKGAPDVLWFEGTAEMRFVSQFLGESTEALDASMNAWWDVTRKQGLAPLGADRTVTGNAYNEYHVWPTAAAGAWAVLSGAATDTDWALPPKE